MVRRVRVHLVDDLDGADAHETVSFALDGRGYEIDLSEENAARLRMIFAPYVEAGRKTGEANKTSSERGALRADSPWKAKRQRNRAIRQWAQQNHIRMWHRGRIPNSVLARYEAETDQ